jgi:ribonuclease HII
MLFAGVDEAGRGPIIGPMVMATVFMREADLDKLKLLGVKDSKLLSKQKREELYDDILDIVADYKIVIVPNTEIDEAVNGKESNLNRLELIKTAEMLNSIPELEKAYVDCPSINMVAYNKDLMHEINNKKLRLVAEHKADMNYPIVAAASILAKVTRDREIEKIMQQFDVDFGSGYLTDPKTIAFLEKNYDKYPFFRKSWSTWKNLAKKKNQKTLTNFVDVPTFDEE